MEFLFFDAAGTLLFVRGDLEEGHWVQQEMSVNATFPFLDGKVIGRGQRIAFRDPATGNLEVFEIRKVTNTEPDHYQQITAEHIAIAELTDEHLDEMQIDNTAVMDALRTVLAGTQWNAGVLDAVREVPASSADIGRGSVWQAVNTVCANWNVYVVPRVVISGDGQISGRYLDVIPSGGIWRGVRLSIDKNMSDATVTYDDTEVKTALYAYGGTPDGGDNPITLEGAAWNRTADHPAKAAAQKYLEWPEKTAIYGRNGRPRFGYYQNADITDQETLLQKTWEALKETADPKINISGTVTDLYRLGYQDQPLRLHDVAIVEIRQTGELFQKEITSLDVDLVDPTANMPEIGDYIPNIIYINRETNEYATGETGGGGGRRGGKSNGETEKDIWRATMTGWNEENEKAISMVVGKDPTGKKFIKAGEITLAINKQTGESDAKIDAHVVSISAQRSAHSVLQHWEEYTNPETGLIGLKLVTDAGMIMERPTEGGVRASFGVFDEGNLTGGIIVDKINDGSTTTRLKGTRVIIGELDDKDLEGWARDAKDGKGVFAKFLTVKKLTAEEITTLLANIGNANIGSLRVADLFLQGQSGMGYLSVKNCINTAVVTKNELKLYRMNGELAATFSKATALSGKWSGAKYTVTARQNGVSVGTNVAQIKQLTKSGSVLKIGKNVGQEVYVYATENGGANGVTTGFHQQVWIDASDIYQDGYNAGRSSGGSYRSFGQFTRYGTTTVGGETYTLYMTKSTSASISNETLYRKV